MLSGIKALYNPSGTQLDPITLAGILLLLALLILKELSLAALGNQQENLRKALDIGLALLGIAFALFVLYRLLEIIHP